MVRKTSSKQKELIAEFLGNIGVAWFAAGVIGVFLSGSRNPLEIAVSVTWGVALSIAFLYAGTYLMKGVPS